MEKRHIVFTNAADSKHKKYSYFTEDFIHSDLTTNHFLSLAEAIRASVCCWLPDTTLTFVNKNYAEHLHMPAHDLLGRAWINLIPEQEKKRVQEMHQKILSDPKIHIHERRYIDAKKNVRHIEWTDYPVVDKKGEVIEFMSIGRDVTEQRNNKEALVDSENRNAQIISSMQEGMIMQDAQGIITYANDSFLDIFGCDREKIIGKSVYELLDIHKNIIDMLINQTQRQKKTRERSQEVVLYKKSGITHVHASIVPMIDQEGFYKGGFVIVSDISQQKKTEERLKKINECLLNLSENASKNIQYLTRLFGEVMNSTCAIYNQIDEDVLYSYGKWQTPQNYVDKDHAEGHICYDVIKKGSDQPYIVRNLLQTNYYHTDPNVAKYNLQTYVGQAVRSGSVSVGSLCAVFQEDYEPSQDDLKVMGIIASAIGGEVERKESQKMIKNKMKLQNTIARISSRFVGNVDFDTAVNMSLAEMGLLSGARRAYVFLLKDEKHMSNTHDWRASDVKSRKHILQNLPIEKFPWWMGKLNAGEVIDIKDIAELRDAAPSEYALISKIGVKSLLAFPIFANGRVEGFMGFDNVSSDGKWSETDLLLLRVCAEIFGNAIEIKKALEKVRMTKREWEITVDSLPHIVCLIDTYGKIVRVNKPMENWGVSNLHDVRGQGLHDVFHPHCTQKKCEFAHEIDLIWHKALNGVQSELVHKSEWLQKTICIKMYPHAYPSSEDMEYAAVAVAYDITEKIKANQKIFDMFKYLGLINRKVSILLNMRKGSTKKDAQNIYAHVIQSSMQIANAHFSLLYEYDQKGRSFDLLSYGGMLSRNDQKRLTKIKSDAYGFMRKMVRTKKRVQGVASEDAFRAFVIYNKFKKTTHALLAVPVLCQDSLKGMIILGFGKEHDLSTQELEFYDLFALQTCLIMMNMGEK